jgi:hypothetical protein
MILVHGSKFKFILYVIIIVIIIIIFIIQYNIILVLIVLVILHLLMRAFRCPLRVCLGAVEVLAAYFRFCFLVGSDGRRPILLN